MVFVALLATLSNVPAAELNCTWVGGHGVWTDSAKWTNCNGGYPNNDSTNTYTATVTTHTHIQHDGPITINELNWASALTLGGTYQFTVVGGFNWTSGGLDGDRDGGGIFRIENTANVTANAPRLRSVTLINDGIIMADFEQFGGSGGAVIQNLGLWIDETNFNNDFRTSSGGAVFNNIGTYRKSGNGRTLLIWNFTNPGTIDVRNGTFTFFVGGEHSGHFDIAPGATLVFERGDHLFDGVTFGPSTGRLLIDGAIVTIDSPVVITGPIHIGGGGVVMNATSEVNEFLQQGGVGGTGNLTVNGPATWTIGTAHDLIARTGSTTFLNGVLISSGGIKGVRGRTIINDGSSEWHDGEIRMGESGLIRNDGTWIDYLEAENNINNAFGGDPSKFENNGEYLKLGGATTAIEVEFDNGGSIDVQDGVLSLLGGGTHVDSAFLSDSGTLLVFDGQHQFNSNTSVASPNITVLGGTFNIAGSLDVSARMIIDNANANISGPVAQIDGANLTNGIWHVRGGGSLTVSGNEPITTNSAEIVIEGETSGTNLVANLDANSGVLRGIEGGRLVSTKVLSNSGTVDLLGGAFEPAGLTNLPSGLLVGFGTVTADIANSGTIRGTPGPLNEKLNLAGMTMSSSPLEGSILVSGSLASIPTTSVLNAENIEFTPTANLRVTISSDTEFDRLHVSGDLAAAGTILVEFANEYVPVAGSSFPIIQSSGTFEGEFAIAATNAPSNIATHFRIENLAGYADFLHDTDDDGVGDELDAFPDDPTESKDTDGDGVGDGADAFPNDPSETVDSDGDGVGDNADPYPLDPSISSRSKNTIPVLPVPYVLFGIFVILWVSMSTLRREVGL